MSDINTVGTPLGFKYNGTAYRVKADSAPTEMFRKYVSEPVATSGDSMNKKTKQLQSVSGLDLTMNQRERSTFDDDADSGPYIAEYKDAAGVIFTGLANIGGDSSRTSDEGTYSIDIIFVNKPTVIYP